MTGIESPSKSGEIHNWASRLHLYSPGKTPRKPGQDKKEPKKMQGKQLKLADDWSTPAPADSVATIPQSPSDEVSQAKYLATTSLEDAMQYIRESIMNASGSSTHVDELRRLLAEYGAKQLEGLNKVSHYVLSAEAPTTRSRGQPSSSSPTPPQSYKSQQPVALRLQAYKRSIICGMSMDAPTQTTQAPSPAGPSPSKAPEPGLIKEFGFATGKSSQVDSTPDLARTIKPNINKSPPSSSPPPPVQRTDAQSPQTNPAPIQRTLSFATSSLPSGNPTVHAQKPPSPVSSAQPDSERGEDQNMQVSPIQSLDQEQNKSIEQIQKQIKFDNITPESNNGGDTIARRLSLDESLKEQYDIDAAKNRNQPMVSQCTNNDTNSSSHFLRQGGGDHDRGGESSVCESSGWQVVSKDTGDQCGIGNLNNLQSFGIQQEDVTQSLDQSMMCDKGTMVSPLQDLSDLVKSSNSGNKQDSNSAADNDGAARAFQLRGTTGTSIDDVQQHSSMQIDSNNEVSVEQGIENSTVPVQGQVAATQCGVNGQPVQQQIGRKPLHEIGEVGVTQVPSSSDHLDNGRQVDNQTAYQYLPVPQNTKSPIRAQVLDTFQLYASQSNQTTPAGKTPQKKLRFTENKPQNQVKSAPKSILKTRVPNRIPPPPGTLLNVDPLPSECSESYISSTPSFDSVTRKNTDYNSEFISGFRPGDREGVDQEDKAGRRIVWKDDVLGGSDSEQYYSAMCDGECVGETGEIVDSQTTTSIDTDDVDRSQLTSVIGVGGLGSDEEGETNTILAAHTPAKSKHSLPKLERIDEEQKNPEECSNQDDKQEQVEDNTQQVDDTDMSSDHQSGEFITNNAAHTPRNQLVKSISEYDDEKDVDDVTRRCLSMSLTPSDKSPNNSIRQPVTPDTNMELGTPQQQSNIQSINNSLIQHKSADSSDKMANGDEEVAEEQIKTVVSKKVGFQDVQGVTPLTLVIGEASNNADVDGFTNTKEASRTPGHNLQGQRQCKVDVINKTRLQEQFDNIDASEKDQDSQPNTPASLSKASPSGNKSNSSTPSAPSSANIVRNILAGLLTRGKSPTPVRGNNGQSDDAPTQYQTMNKSNDNVGVEPEFVVGGIKVLTPVRNMVQKPKATTSAHRAQLRPRDMLPVVLPSQSPVPINKNQQTQRASCLPPLSPPRKSEMETTRQNLMSLLDDDEVKQDVQNKKQQQGKHQKIQRSQAFNAHEETDIVECYSDSDAPTPQLAEPFDLSTGCKQRKRSELGKRRKGYIESLDDERGTRQCRMVSPGGGYACKDQNGNEMTWQDVLAGITKQAVVASSAEKARKSARQQKTTNVLGQHEATHNIVNNEAEVKADKAGSNSQKDTVECSMELSFAVCPSPQPGSQSNAKHTNVDATPTSKPTPWRQRASIEKAKKGNSPMVATPVQLQLERSIPSSPMVELNASARKSTQSTPQLNVTPPQQKIPTQFGGDSPVQAFNMEIDEQGEGGKHGGEGGGGGMDVDDGPVPSPVAPCTPAEDTRASGLETPNTIKKDRSKQQDTVEKAPKVDRKSGSSKGKAGSGCVGIAGSLEKAGDGPTPQQNQASAGKTRVSVKQPSKGSDACQGNDQLEKYITPPQAVAGIKKHSHMKAPVVATRHVKDIVVKQYGHSKRQQPKDQQPNKEVKQNSAVKKSKETKTPSKPNNGNTSALKACNQQAQPAITKPPWIQFQHQKVSTPVQSVQGSRQNSNQASNKQSVVENTRSAVASCGAVAAPNKDEQQNADQTQVHLTTERQVDDTKGKSFFSFLWQKQAQRDIILGGVGNGSCSADQDKENTTNLNQNVQQYTNPNVPTTTQQPGGLQGYKRPNNNNNNEQGNPKAKQFSQPKAAHSRNFGTRTRASGTSGVNATQPAIVNPYRGQVSSKASRVVSEQHSKVGDELPSFMRPTKAHTVRAGNKGVIRKPVGNEHGHSMRPQGWNPSTKLVPSATHARQPSGTNVGEPTVPVVASGSTPAPPPGTKRPRSKSLQVHLLPSIHAHVEASRPSYYLNLPGLDKPRPEAGVFGANVGVPSATMDVGNEWGTPEPVQAVSKIDGLRKGGRNVLGDASNQHNVSLGCSVSNTDASTAPDSKVTSQEQQARQVNLQS